MANTALIANANTAIADGQTLQALCTKLYNDVGKLVGNMATTLTAITNSTTGYQIPDLIGIDDDVNAAIAFLTYVDNKIVRYQSSATIPS